MGHWYTSLPIWRKIKPLAQQFRREPTPAEAFLWSRLRYRQIAGVKFRRQHPIDRFIVDFYCQQAKLIIEVDGAIHGYSVEEDATRQEFLESIGFEVLRFKNEDVFNDIERVVRVILVKTKGRLKELDETKRCPHPNPPRKRGGRLSIMRPVRYKSTSSFPVNGEGPRVGLVCFPLAFPAALL